MTKTVAIHQPNFLPWLGYFDKMLRADVFIVMDNAQYVKSGGTWSNRVKAMISGEPRWLTMPIVRNYHGLRTYGEIEIDDTGNWRTKAIKSLQAAYARTPHFREVMPLVESLLVHPTRSLVELNVNAALQILQAIGLAPRQIVFGSTLTCTGQATDLLIEMVRAVGGTTYLCGGGAEGYQEDDKFATAGLKLQYQSFRHPEYPQRTGVPFAPGLSIVDALFWCGWAGTVDLLQHRIVGENNAEESRHAA